MEDVAPLLKLIWAVKKELEQGRSLKNSLQAVFEMGIESKDLAHFLIELNQPSISDEFYRGLRSQIRKSLFRLFAKGSRGEPISEQLEELEKEVICLCEEQLDHHLQKLPYLMVFPVFVLQVPAFLLLLFGPILNSFLESLSGL